MSLCRPSLGSFLPAVALAAALAVPHALATSDTWNGGTDSNWSTNANWVTNPAVVPGTTDTATFNNSLAGATQTITTGNIQIGTITFDTASVAAYILGGATAGTGQINLDDNGAINMTSSVAANELINANLVLGTAIAASYTVTNASTTNTLTLAGSVQRGSGGTAGTKTLVIAGAGNTTLSGTITNSASTMIVSVTSTGTTTLSGTGSVFSTLGVSTTAAGNVTLASNIALNGASLINGSGGTINSTGGQILLNVAAGDIGISNGGTLTINAVIANGTQSALDFFNASNGTGIVILTADNTFSGTTNLQSGVITVTKIGNSGVAGNLGMNGTLNIGSTTSTSATLKYTGTGEPTNRVINLAGTTAGGTIDASGSGLLKFTSDFTATGAGSKTLTLTGTGTGEVAGKIVDNSLGVNKTSVTKAGVGTWTLSGANPFTGNVTMTAGILNVTNTSSLGGGTVIFNGGTLSNTSGAALTFANSASVNANSTFGVAGNTSANNVIFSGTTAFSQDLNRTLALVGTGTTLTIAAAWQNTIDTSGRTLTVNGAGNTFILGGLALDTVAAGTAHTHTINGTGNVTLSGAIVNGAAPGAQALTYSGSGILTLNGDNTYLGLTTVNNASGTVTLTGNNTGGGGVTLTTGRLNVNSAGALNTGTVTLTAGTLDNTSGVAVTNANNNAITISGNFSFGGSNNLNLGTGAITSTFVRTITLNGSATLTLGGIWTQTSEADNTFTVNGAGRTLVLGGLVLDNTGTTARTQTIAGSGNVTITGAIVNGGGLAGQKFAVNNTGVITLQGASTYTGTTSVLLGSLVLGNGGSLAATAVTVSGGATFGAQPGVTGATNSIGSSLALNTGSTFSMADGATSTLNVTTTTAFTGGFGSTLVFDLGGATTAADKLAITGAASGTGGTIIQINGIGTTALATGAYTIIQAASGLNSTNFSLAANKVVVNGVDYEVTLTKNAGTTVLNVTGLTGIDQAWWTGDQSAVWNTNNSGNTNWATDATGVADAGTTPNSVTDVFFSAAGATNLSNGLGANTTINSLTFTSGAVTLGAGNTLTIGSTNGIAVQSGAAAQTINSALSLSVYQTWETENTLTVNGIISGAGGFAKSGVGNLILGAANTYTGLTTIDNGTLQLNVNETMTGGLNFGVVNGSTNVSTLDLSNANGSFGAGSVRTNSAAASTVLVGAGHTFTLTNGLTVGYDAGAGSGAVTSNLTVTGAGSFSITGGSVTVSANQAATNATYFSVAALDFSGLTGGFTANVTNFNVGVGSSTTGSGSLLLTNTSNTITATLFQVGNSGGNNGNGATSSLTLGTGSNVIHADTINIGFSKVGGTLTFVSQTAGSPGTVIITNKAGTGNAAITVGSNNGTGTAAVFTGLLDLRGHLATVSSGAMGIGLGNNTNTGNTTGIVDFDTGTFTVAGLLTIGSKSGTLGTGTATGNLNISGGTFTVTATGSVALGVSAAATGTAIGNLNLSGGTLTVNGGFAMANTSTTAPGTSTANLNVTGGLLTSNVDILKVGTTAGATANITLNGASASSAVIDMTGHVIGSSTLTVNLSAQVGTLQNVGEINGGTTGLTKNTSGTLIVTGTNTYTGATAVSAGTLQVGSGNSGSVGAGTTVTVNGATAVLAGTGTINGATTITLGQIKPGDSAGANTGTLNINNTLTFNPASPSTVGTFDLSGPSVSDKVHVTGALTLNSSSNFVVQTVGYSVTYLDSFTLMDWANVGLNGWSAGANLRDGSADSGTNLDLPDLTGTGWVWQINSITDGAAGALVVTVVPEPGRAGLLLGGLALVVLRRRRRVSAA